MKNNKNTYWKVSKNYAWNGSKRDKDYDDDYGFDNNKNQIDKELKINHKH